MNRRRPQEAADRVLMFDDGGIVEEDTAEKLLRDPDQERTRTFLRAVLEH